jgi:hypothetical protein
MSDITRLSVLEAFIKYKRLTFTDFAQKGIFFDYDGGSKRGEILHDIISELESMRILERFSPPIGWEVTNMDTNKRI